MLHVESATVALISACHIEGPRSVPRKGHNLTGFTRDGCLHGDTPICEDRDDLVGSRCRVDAAAAAACVGVLGRAGEAYPIVHAGVDWAFRTVIDTDEASRGRGG